MMRTRLLNGCSCKALGSLGADNSVTTVTVSPNACQTAAFGPNGTTGITALDWAHYYLCEMGADIESGASWLWQELVDGWNSLWQWLQNLWGQIINGSIGQTISNAVSSVGHAIQQAAQNLWDAVKNLWNQWQQAWSQFSNGMMLIAVAAAVGAGLYIANYADNRRKARA